MIGLTPGTLISLISWRYLLKRDISRIRLKNASWLISGDDWVNPCFIPDSAKDQERQLFADNQSICILKKGNNMSRNSRLNNYVMYKGKLSSAAPYLDGYKGDPHYIIKLGDASGDEFNIVVNSLSNVKIGGDNRILSYIDQHFDDPIVDKLKPLALGLHTDGFPRLDYWQDRSLLDIHRFRVVPYKDVDGSRFDINDQINALLTIDQSQPFEELPYVTPKYTDERKFWKPTGDTDVIVYGFGFLFLPKKDGLHETHMNQGNPRGGGHEKENGAFQDGGVIIEIGGSFAAIFTAFQSQLVPTRANGYPTDNAVPIMDYVNRH